MLGAGHVEKILSCYQNACILTQNLIDELNVVAHPTTGTIER